MYLPVLFFAAVKDLSFADGWNEFSEKS